MSDDLEIQSDEKILIMVRKHWFSIFRDSIGVIVFFIVIFGIALGLSGITDITTSPNGIAIMCLLLVCLTIALGTIWTNYYLDIFMVTDKRLIILEQITLFKRDILTLRIERIQDTLVKVHGFLAESLDYGDIIIQTAGRNFEDKTLDYIPRPEHVKNIILEQIDTATDHVNKLTHTTTERPSHME
jgi:hypothetical protein